MRIMLLCCFCFFRANALEAALLEKEKSLSDYIEKFTKLKDDFKYNLKLLKERDEELAVYDAQAAGLQNILQS